MKAPAPVVVVGAGLAGLVAARELRRLGVPVLVFEAGKTVAGLAQSFRDAEGFTHDFGAHFITNRLAAALGVGASCRDVHRYGEAFFIRGRAYRFPLGLLTNPGFVASAVAGRLRRRSGPPASAAEWYRRAYGRRVADEVAIPLVEAWSGASAADLAPSVIPPQVDRGTLHVLKLQVASRLTGRAVANGYSREKPESPHVWHVYPEGSLGQVGARLLADLPGIVCLETPVQAILVEQDRAVAVRAGGRTQEASAVLSTAPVHVLPKLVQGSGALAHLARFRYRGMTLVNMRFEGRGLMPEVVTWMPDPALPFFRITEVPLSMPWLAPEGRTTLTVDIGSDPGDAIWAMAEEDVGRLCLEHLERLFPGIAGRYLGCRVLRTPVAYPVFLREYEADRVALERGLPVEGLHSIGRNGEFAHILMEDVYWRTLRTVHRLAARLRR
jgi:oxygen-dependent protoporphyrinogen oxidase